MSDTWVYSAAVWYLRKVNTGMTPAGGIYMVSSSFQTENCWMYLGRQDNRYWPYAWRLVAFSAYLSAGLTRGTLRAPVAAILLSVFHYETRNWIGLTRPLCVAHIGDIVFGSYFSESFEGNAEASNAIACSCARWSNS